MDLVNHLTDRLLFAVPKKGRLNENALDLLAGSDIQFHRHSRLDIALVKNLPIALIFLPAADIPTFVGEGRVDLGITGRDQVAEYEANEPELTTKDGGPAGVEEIMDLQFGACKLQVQVPENGSIQSPEQLVGRNVVTSFTGLSAQYFKKLEGATTNGTSGGADSLRTHIKYVGGSVEAACALGVADGIVDLVGKSPPPSSSRLERMLINDPESGETMRAAGLKAIDTVVESTAVLIQSRRPSNPDMIQLIASRIRGVLTARSYVLCAYNIRRKDLDRAKVITPGRRAPTVASLEDSDWVAVSVMVERKKIAVVMDELVKIAAEDVLVTRIENSRMQN